MVMEESRNPLRLDASRPVLNSQPRRPACHAGRRENRKWLRQRRSRLALHERSVDRVDKSVDVDILAEIRQTNSVPRLRFGLADVDSIAESIRVGVAGENSH